MKENYEKIQRKCMSWMQENFQGHPPSSYTTDYSLARPTKAPKHNSFDLAKIKQKNFDGKYSDSNHFFFITNSSFRQPGGFLLRALSKGQWFYSGHIFRFSYRKENPELVEYVTTPGLISEKSLEALTK